MITQPNLNLNFSHLCKKTSLNSIFKNQKCFQRDQRGWKADTNLGEWWTFFLDNMSFNLKMMINSVDFGYTRTIIKKNNDFYFKLWINACDVLHSSI